MRSTRIVCTIGPSSRDYETIEQMVRAGMDVARLNMSHGDQQQHLENIQRIRTASEAVGRPVAILMDLAGPKLRLGRLDKPVFLKIGDEVTLTIDPIIGRDNVIPVEYPDLIDDLQIGDHCSLADGVVGLEVVDKDKRSVRARVLSAGEVRTRQGIHIPTGANKVPVMSDKDVEDLRMGVREEVDWIALSFVRRASDADWPRKLMEEMGRRIPLIAKIERRQALQDLDAILETFDGIMVARGDLGVEMPIEEVPAIQKRVIRQANLAAKPVITATQMLLSMVSSPLPTRAEVNDVANAILDGTDAVMLSEETARGAHPVETLATMGRIAECTEAIADTRLPEEPDLPMPVNMAISRATRKVVELVGARLIITPTATGSTPLLIRRNNPTVPVLALAHNPCVVRQLCLARGILPRLVPTVFTTADQLFDCCMREARASGLPRPGDRVVVTAGFPLSMPGTTNLLQVLEV